jgi:dihydrofolate synthase / folylpolyglutamate synthase
MNYQEIIPFLYSQFQSFQKIGKDAYKPGLDNALSLDQYFGKPHKKYKTIHIAGTNGKGSVSHLLASVLQEAGYKTGLFTSPHLKDFRERIRVNGLMISEDEVVDYINKNKEIIEKIKPSFFEMTSAMAFYHFMEHETEISIIETGLGGRLDSTNIIKPILSIITNIGLDHTDLLGDTIEKIAQEKAGIIKEGVPIVIGETYPQTKTIFENIADDLYAEIIFADQGYTIDSFQTANDLQQFRILKNNKSVYEGLKSQLLGIYQQKNVATVIATIDILREKGLEISDKHVYNGFKNVVTSTGLLGRWQILSRKPLIVCDTGHNEDGMREVVKQIALTKYNKLHIVFGMVRDKEISTVLASLPKNAVFYFTKAGTPRALNKVELKEKAEKFGLKGNSYPNVEEAFLNAKKTAKEDDMIFVGGSTFVVAEVL